MDESAGFGAIVLAGGRSSRFGRDKASEPLLGRPLLQHVVDRIAPLFHELIIVRAPGQQLPSIESSLAVRIVDDAFPGAGPLGGIYTGLGAATAERCLAVACDMPLLSAPLLRELQRRAAVCDVVMPVLAYSEPLHALYSRVCLEPMRARLDAGQLKITGFLGAVHVCYMREAECRALDPELRSFVNTNTEEDLLRVETILRAETNDH
jgi:molybdopterin-guanine dinucleotide biosynthesis protein A